MSQAFVKETEGAEFEPLPERPVSTHPNFVTLVGMAQIESELRRLDTIHAAAVRDGDKFAIARSERDLRYWSARRASAQLVEPPTDTDRVQFGSTVTIRRDDGREQTFRIVGEDEADPGQGTLSHVSPLARALFGKSVGDVVSAGAQEAEITAIA
jgi:transcription elongation GreA/GreB family factor